MMRKEVVWVCDGYVQYGLLLLFGLCVHAFVCWEYCCISSRNLLMVVSVR